MKLLVENKTKSLIDTIASYNGYTRKIAFMQTHFLSYPKTRDATDLKNLKEKIPKIINYKIRKLAEINTHEEFVAADFYM